MKKCLSMALAIIMLLCLIPTTTVFAAKENFLILSNVSISGVTTPVVGETPVFNATSDETGKYSVSKVTWAEYDLDFDHIKDMGSNDKFREGYYYFVFVTLEAKGAYTFGNNMSQTINQKSANKYTPSDGGKKVQVYTHFESLKPISKVEFNVVMPVIGKTPTFAKVDTAEYYSVNLSGVSNMTNGVFWRNTMTGTNITVNNPFKADGKYYVCYCITPKEGYLFTDTTKYYINGRIPVLEFLTLDDGKSAVKMTLVNLVPTDAIKVINSLDLSVTAPKDGEKPDFSKIDGTGYYSDNGINGTSTKIYKNGIAWFKSNTSYISPGTTETYKGGKNYTVKIALTPKNGYKFGTSVNAKINGKTATVETFDDGSINVSVTLTAMNKEHTHTAGSTWQYDDTEHWKICSDKNCGTLVGEKQMHSNSDADGKCDICGYQLPIEVPEGTTNPGSTTTDPTQKPTDGTSNPTDGATEPTDSTTETSGSETTGTPTTNGNTDQKDNGNKDNGIILWIVLGIVIVLAAGAVVTVVLLKKKNAKKVDG